MNWVIFPIAHPISSLTPPAGRLASCYLLSPTGFAEVLRGIESVTDAHGYQTMLAHYGYKPEMEQERLESMLSWNIDGLILTERTHTPRTLKMIEVAGIPVVELMDSKSPCLDIAVGFDNFEAARQMTTAIIARGHRHIAYLGARLDERTIIKQKGYEQAMLDAGPVPYSVMVEQSSSYSSGIELIRRARREYPQLDGVFCTNDDWRSARRLNASVWG